MNLIKIFLLLSFECINPHNPSIETPLSSKGIDYNKTSKYNKSGGHHHSKQRYNVELISKTLSFKDLPEEFDGFKIALIADIHIGYFDSSHLKKISNAFYSKSKNKNIPPADIILFLGDLVNYHINEITPKHKKWLMSLRKYSKYGLMFSILGNHDYDGYDFMMAKTPEKGYDLKMKNIQRQLGWDLLDNSHILLKKGKSQLKFIGIEHLGKCTVIPNKGNINKAIKNLNKIYKITNDKNVQKLTPRQDHTDYKTFPIMLAHDPNIINKLWYGHHFPLVLSGHTHGAKVMLDGIKGCSMDSLFCSNRYPSGLYKSYCGNKYLYVSKGVGLSGVNLFGKEIIMNDRKNKRKCPEVVIITLKKK